MPTAQSVFTDHLSQLLHEIALHQQTGMLRLEHIGERGIERGEIYFEAGETILARTERETGKTALMQMLNWGSGYYTFFEGVQSPFRHVSISQQETRLLPILRGEKHTPSALPRIPKSTGPLARVVQATPLPQPARTPLKQDEQRMLPGQHAVFRALPDVCNAKTLNTLERRERIVFLLLDGRRTLHTVAQLTHHSEVTVARILVNLFRRGYIEYIRG